MTQFLLLLHSATTSAHIWPWLCYDSSQPSHIFCSDMAPALLAVVPALLAMAQALFAIAPALSWLQLWYGSTTYPVSPLFRIFLLSFPSGWDRKWKMWDHHQGAYILYALQGIPTLRRTLVSCKRSIYNICVAAVSKIHMFCGVLETKLGFA